MTTDAGPAQLREAADRLAQAAAATNPRDAQRLVADAIFDPMGDVCSGICSLASFTHWRRDPGGMRWLAQAARLRLMVEAWRLEHNGTDATIRWSGTGIPIEVSAITLLIEWLREATP